MKTSILLEHISLPQDVTSDILVDRVKDQVSNPSTQDQSRTLLKKISTEISRCKDLEEGYILLRQEQDGSLFLDIHSAKGEGEKFSDEEAKAGKNALEVLKPFFNNSDDWATPLRNYLGKYDQYKTEGLYEAPKTEDDRFTDHLPVNKLNMWISQSLTEEVQRDDELESAGEVLDVRCPYGKHLGKLARGKNAECILYQDHDNKQSVVKKLFQHISIQIQQDGKINTDTTALINSLKESVSTSDKPTHFTIYVDSHEKYKLYKLYKVKVSDSNDNDLVCRWIEHMHQKDPKATISIMSVIIPFTTAKTKF